MEESPSRSPRLPRSPRLGHRRTPGRGGGTGKTLSMENIQSLNAAYATSGPMYLSDHEGVGSTTYPKGTMTLGRATSRATYGGRVTAMGSSPNIASAGLPHGDMLSYGDHGGMPPHSHQVPSGLRQLRDNAMLDLQSQMKDLQRENDLLRRELDVKDSKLGSSMNSIKTFWSPELKKERVMRKEEIARTSVLKEQMRVTHEENQVTLHDANLVISFDPTHCPHFSSFVAVGFSVVTLLSIIRQLPWWDIDLFTLSSGKPLFGHSIHSPECLQVFCPLLEKSHLVSHWKNKVNVDRLEDCQ